LIARIVEEKWRFPDRPDMAAQKSRATPGEANWDAIARSAGWP